MTLFVLTKDGKPVELPNFIDAERPFYKMTVASTVRENVERTREILPNVLDADHGPEVYEIEEYTP